MSAAALSGVGKSSVKTAAASWRASFCIRDFSLKSKHSWSLLGFRSISGSPAPCKVCCAHLVPTLPRGHQAGIRK